MQPAEFRPAQNYDTNPYYDNAEWPGPGYVTIEPLSATENKTYTAEEGKAYSPVTVNVPFVVEPLTVTENDTYTAPEGKAYSPVTVNVASGVSFGAPQRCCPLMSSARSPIGVGETFYADKNGWLMDICEIDSGNDVIMSAYNGEYPGEPQSLYAIASVASGLTVKSAINYQEDFDYNFRMAIVEAEYDEVNGYYSITSVVQDLTSGVSQSIYTSHDENGYAMFSFVVPEVPEGKYLVYSVEYPD